MKKQRTDKIKNLDLSVFEDKLRAMAENGEIDSALATYFDTLDLENGPDLLNGSEVRKLYQTVNKASHTNAILKARKTVSIEGLPFGRFLHSVRDKSGLTKSDTAKLLNKDNPYIEKIENGQLNPLELGAANVADIMQLFRLTMTELITTVKTSLMLAKARPAKASAMGRSSIKDGSAERNDALSFAMDAAFLAIKKQQGKKQSDKAKIDPKYIDTIKKLLQERDETDLLV